jgi:hypothetical protein
VKTHSPAAPCIWSELAIVPVICAVLSIHPPRPFEISQTKVFPGTTYAYSMFVTSWLNFSRAPMYTASAVPGVWSNQRYLGCICSSYQLGPAATNVSTVGIVVSSSKMFLPAPPPCAPTSL